MVGTRLGSYRLEEEIGRGGMGIVYRAVQETLNRLVAVKVLAPHLVADPEFVERFLREARAAAHLDHPGIVTVYDVGEQDGNYYFAMQLMPGTTLEHVVVGAGRLDVGQAAGVGIQVADALAYAHREGIYHRDIKPANILIDRTGRCVLTDFGIAWAASETRLTRSGTMLGSPDFMSPEAVQGDSTDGRSDLYSFGVLLYQALTGSTPFSGETAVAVAYQHLNVAAPDVRDSNPTVPKEIARIVGRLMAKRPEDRYQQAIEVRDDLWKVTGGVIPGLPGTDTAAMVASPTPAPQERPTMTAPMKRRRSLAGVGLAVSVLGLAAVAAVYVTMARPFASAPTGGGGGPVPTPVAAETSAGRSSETPGAPALPTASQADVAEEPAIVGPRVVQIESEPAGAEIWVDGVDRHLLTPAAVELTGETGQEIQIALVRDGATVASRRLTIGSDLPELWSADLLVENMFTITSQPAGATVVLSGTRLEGTTPLTVELRAGTLYDLRLELDGHDPSGFDFRLDDLSAAQRESRTLHFPLRSAVPPGLLALRAEYPVTLSLGGRTVSLDAGSNELELRPGSYDVAVSAPSVHYAGRHSLEIRPDETTRLALPPAVSVTVAAAPGRCRVAIDGSDIDYVPFAVDLAVGEHAFEFHWDSLGVTRSVRRRVTAETSQVFEAAGEEP